MKKYHYLYCLLMTILSFNTNASVVITIDNQPITFDSLPRLYNVLLEVKNPDTIYWPAAQLFKIDGNNTAAQREDFSQRFDRYTTALPKASVELTLLTGLKKRVESWTLGYFVDVPVDIDLARTTPENNPRFDAGAYLLNVSSRKTEYLLTGLVNRDASMKIDPKQCLGEELNNVPRWSFADNDYVIVVQPNGEVFDYGIAYWNRECQHLMPGSQIIFMFEKSFFSNQATDLNQQLAKLARNRIIQ